MLIKRFAGMMLLAALLCAAATPAAVAGTKQDTSQATGQTMLLDGIVAVVDDHVILLSQLKHALAQARQQLERHNTPIPPAAALRHQVLQQLILIELQLEAGKRQGVHVSDSVLNEVLTNIAQKQGTTLSQLPERLASEGINYSRFRQQIRRQMIVSRTQKKVISGRITITPSEIQHYLLTQEKEGHGRAQYHLLQILLKVPAKATSAQADKIHQKAEAIEKKLKGGANFQAIAAATSDGRRALQGGDLGWLRGGELPVSLADTILKMNKGEISAPIKDQAGYHILKLADKRVEHKVIVTQTHARHILITPNLLVSNTEAREHLDKLRKKIESGASFAKLAKKYSDDPGSAAKGGALGWLNPGEVVPKFQTVMDKLQPGQISTPFQTRFGWHIVEVIGRRKQNQTDKVRRRQAYAAIHARKRREQMNRWLHNLKANAYIDIKLHHNGFNADAG